MATTAPNETKHIRGTRAEWRAARVELLKEEKALTRKSDELARRRQELPWVRVDKVYRFDTDAGNASLADLFQGRSQLLVYHFMLGPDYKAGCPSCSAIADGFNGFAVHLANHDVMLTAVSRAPLANGSTWSPVQGGNWQLPASPEGQYGLQGTPAVVSSGPGRTDVFAVSRYGELWWWYSTQEPNGYIWQDGAGGTGSPNPAPLVTTGVTGDPLAISRGSGEVEVFYRNVAGSLVHLTYLNGAWGSPETLLRTTCLMVGRR